MDKKHKIGRNDPCPCGSGKKYKRCCGVNPQSDIQGDKDVDRIKLNREIAYVGKIGRKREEFCRRYIKRKESLIREIEQSLAKETEAKGETITCHKGCSFCCSQHVSALIQECEAIVYYLYQHEKLLNDFVEAYPRWRKEVGRNISLFNKVGQLYNESIADRNSKEKEQVFKEASDHYFAQNIPCPFLSEDLCSIYPVRPWVCASVIATSPAELCKPSIPNKPRILGASLGKADFDIRIYDKIELAILTPVPKGVYGILAYGTYYLSKIPGLESLEQEAINDPEVRAILRKYL